ncbi:MAG: type I secretion system permease/ATPase [Gammaproteobacteria bacterium]|nr:type I secretion system permease/ATPase [Gammaproteobacteria bacterium]
MSDDKEKHGLSNLLRACKHGVFYTLALSCLINILMLTIPIYMLQVFDRVIPSQSFDTLTYLTLIAIIAIMVLGMLDLARTLIMTRISTWMDKQLSPVALSRSIDHTLMGGRYGAQALADITNTRQFLSSASVYTFFDAPWVFIYLAVIFMLYAPLGFISTIGAIILFALCLLNEKLSRKPLQEANDLHMQNQTTIQNNLKNAESIQAMGMIAAITEQWFHKNDHVLNLQTEASDRSGMVLSLSKSLRMVLQILILGCGAYYVVNGDITSGAMLASSIILSRALAPVEQSIGVWKQAVGCLQSYRRLKQYFETPEIIRSELHLPQPKGLVSVENVLYVPRGATKAVLQNIHFTLNPSDSLAIIGQSGAGKSTLARLLVGIWPPSNGAIRLDGASIFECSRDDIGHYIGYLAQGMMLFPGTVKANIARMGEVDDNQVVAAAKFVGAHEVILHFEHGYETETGAYNLSGGQRQLVGLARAFYGLPRFVVLDEPESNLDQNGLLALETTLKRAKSAGITVIMVTQRPSCASFCDQVMTIENGQIRTIGPHINESKKPS